MAQAAFEQANANAPAPRTIDEVLSGMTMEFRSLHRDMVALAPQTGIAAPNLVKSAAACGVSLDNGPMDMLASMAMQVLTGGLGGGLALDAVTETASQMYTSRNDRKAHFNSLGMNMPASRAKKRQAAMAPAPAPKPVDEKTRAKLRVAQAAKAKRFAAVMEQIAMLNDMKAQGVEMVAPTATGDFGALDMKAPRKAAEFKLPAPRPSFAPRPGFGFAAPTLRPAA